MVGPGPSRPDSGDRTKGIEDLELAGLGEAVMLPDGVTLVAALPAQAQLVYFDTEKFAETSRVKVDFKPSCLAVQNDLLLAGVDGAATVVVLEAKTGQRKGEIELPGVAVAHVACHPSGGPVFASNVNLEVCQLDPQHMKATRTKALGGYLAVAPTGDYLYTGIQPQSREQLKVIEDTDGNLRFLWDNWGTRASMFKYVLRSRRLQLVDGCSNAAVNAHCLALSADGSTIAMAGGGGWRPEAPLQGGGYQVTFFRTKDMESTSGKVEVGAYPRAVVFHPQLKMGVACQGGIENRLIVFDGKSFVTREEFNLGKGPAPDRILLFANRGRSLLFGSGVGLHRIALKLSEEDLKGIRDFKEPRQVVNSNDPATPDETGERPAVGKREKVPLVALTALESGEAADEVSAKEIGRQYLRSVLVLRGADSSGTGFVVGRDGYILTCAHVINPAATMTVSYKTETGSTATARATVLRVDEERDLALVRIEGKEEFPTVQLAVGDTVEAGERVTVIGNPGLGRTILDHTMTEGIVSNPSRDLDGQRLVQTSAPVNPGSSGGPMFNSRGEVIGVVVLKGNIEGAGFAVPAGDVLAFLFEAAKTDGADGQITRTWTDSTGKYRVKAQYLKFDDPTVELKRTDNGQTIRLPLTKLSKTDRELLRMLHAKSGH